MIQRNGLLYNWAALHEKVLNVLSRFNTKRSMECHESGNPSFFWYDTDYLNFFVNFFFLIFFFFSSPVRPFFWYDNDSGHYGPFRVTQLGLLGDGKVGCTVGQKDNRYDSKVWAGV